MRTVVRNFNISLSHVFDDHMCGILDNIILCFTSNICTSISPKT